MGRFLVRVERLPVTSRSHARTDGRTDKCKISIMIISAACCNPHIQDSDSIHSFTESLPVTWTQMTSGLCQPGGRWDYHKAWNASANPRYIYICHPQIILRSQHAKTDLRPSSLYLFSELLMDDFFSLGRSILPSRWVIDCSHLADFTVVRLVWSYIALKVAGK